MVIVSYSDTISTPRLSSNSCTVIAIISLGRGLCKIDVSEITSTGSCKIHGACLTILPLGAHIDTDP